MLKSLRWLVTVYSTVSCMCGGHGVHLTLKLLALNARLNVFLTGYIVAMVTSYVKMIRISSRMSRHFFNNNVSLFNNYSTIFTEPEDNNCFSIPVIAQVIIRTTAVSFILVSSESEVLKALQAVKTRKAVGPDLIPNRVLNEFAPELAAVVRDIYNSSLVEGYFPDFLKATILIPIPKISPPQQIEKDLRPIALTCALAKVMEGFTRARLISQVTDKIDPRQYACAGRSTTDALVYLLQAVYEAVDTGNNGARLFMADFSKGFDMIDHEVLIKELEKLDVHPVLVNWIKPS